MINISGSLEFQNLDEYDSFIAQTEKQVLLSVTRADSFQLVIDLPRVLYTSLPIGMAGRGRNVVTFDGVARYHTGSASQILATLTTTKSDY